MRGQRCIDSTHRARINRTRQALQTKKPHPQLFRSRRDLGAQVQNVHRVDSPRPSASLQSDHLLLLPRRRVCRQRIAQPLGPGRDQRTQDRQLRKVLSSQPAGECPRKQSRISQNCHQPEVPRGSGPSSPQDHPERVPRQPPKICGRVEAQDK